MRKLMIACILLITFSAKAQNPLEDQIPKHVYCEILGYARLLSAKVTVEIDFGEKRNVWRDNRVKDPKTGKKIVFNSMVDALNYMGKKGWEFMQAYVVTTGNQNVYRWLLKKPFADLDPEDQELELKAEKEN